MGGGGESGYLTLEALSECVEMGDGGLDTIQWRL